MIEIKECNVCGELKPLSEFYTQKRKSKDKGEWIYHHPECKECTKDRSKKWLSENKERRKELNHRYSMSDKGKAHFRKYGRMRSRNGKTKEWRDKNKDKIKKYRIQRVDNKTHEISQVEWEYCKEYFNHECAYCGVTEIKHKGMYSQQLHKEHVDHEGANDLSNCVPSCRNCKSSKKTTILE